jgi:hypothetical protein
MQPLRVFVPLAIALLVPVAIACGGDDDKKDVTVGVPTTSAAQTQAKTQFCTELAGLKTAATQIQSLNANSTVTDAKRYQANLKLAREKVQASARAVQNVKVDELDKATDNLDKAIEAVPAGATIGAAASSIAPQAQAVLQAQANVHTATACPSS